MPAPPYADPVYRHARRYWASRVEQGDVDCHLCGRPITGEFHLDHVRGQPGGLHPAHPVCNVAEAGRFAQQRRRNGLLRRGDGRLS